MNRSRIHVIATLTAITFAIALPASADYKQAFREGVRAFEKKQWSVVVANMNSAIAQQPRSAERINISGGWNEPYTPHYFLAAALANLGQCDDAATEFRNAGGIPGGEKYKAIVELKCGIKLQSGPTPAELEAARKQEEARKAAEAKKQEDAKAEAARVAEENRKAEAARVAEENRKAEAARVAEENRKAEAARLEAARVAEENRKAEEARKAEDARKADEAKKAEDARLAEQAKAAEAARLAEAKTALNSRIRDANGHLSTAAMGTPKTRAALSAAMKTASAAAARNASLADIAAAKSSLDRMITTIVGEGVQGGGEDDRLIAAVKAYLRGNYNDTITGLTSANFSNAVLKGQAALFRAAAQYALFAMNGRKDENVAQQIAADLAQYRSAQPGAKPDPRVFSPAFRAFVDQTAAH